METKSRWFTIIEASNPSTGKTQRFRVPTDKVEIFCKFLRAKKCTYNLHSSSEEFFWTELSEADEAWLIAQGL